MVDEGSRLESRGGTGHSLSRDHGPSPELSALYSVSHLMLTPNLTKKLGLGLRLDSGVQSGSR